MKKIFTLLCLSAAYSAILPADPDDDYYYDILHKLVSDIELDYYEEYPSEKIIRKGDLLWCTGNSKAAEANNAACGLLMEGKFSQAAVFLEDSLKRAPLFIPFRNNLAVSYYHIRNFEKAHLSIDKALQQVPQYYYFYLQKGIICELSFKYDDALQYYKKAASLNKIDADPLVIIGDLYFARNQHTTAGRYYNEALKRDPVNPNAILGTAKILFYREKIYLCYMTMKKIDLTKDFDKSYYYYFAESAYKLKKYREAYKAYTELLKYRYDRFFINTALSLIEYKADMAGKFADLESDIAE